MGISLAAERTVPKADRRAETAPVELLVCATCRIASRMGTGTDPAGVAQTDPTAPRDGARFLELLTRSALPENLVIRSVECLSNCTRGCSIALRGRGRWTYVYGNIDPAEHLDTVIDGITRYATSVDGLVPWRERPDHFRKNCIARIPPLEASNE